MKKILLILAALFILALFLIYQIRIKQNTTSITPYPFHYPQNLYANTKITAPILIVGDSLAVRLASFKKRLSRKLSLGFERPIKIQSLATQGENIHRTVIKIKNLTKTPPVIIYLGNKDYNFEKLYASDSIENIKYNFQLYENETLRTLLMIFPSISRLVYRPINKLQLTQQIKPDETEYTDPIYQKRQEINFKLYQAALEEFFTFTKKQNSLVIPVTTPINLKIPPNKSCYGSFSGDATEIQTLQSLVDKKDFKSAYQVSRQLVLLYPANAVIQYLYSQVLTKLNRHNEAQEHAQLAIAYDCHNDRPNPIYNVILKESAKNYKYNYLDFHQFLTDESINNPTFIDETYPQDFYMQSVIDKLASKIRKRLNLYL